MVNLTWKGTKLLFLVALFSAGRFFLPLLAVAACAWALVLTVIIISAVLTPVPRIAERPPIQELPEPETEFKVEAAKRVREIQVVATTRQSDRCPVCMAPIRRSSVTMECDRCGLPHHPECWDWVGKCARYACGGRHAVPVTGKPET
jgi:hypothetical protein